MRITVFIWFFLSTTCLAQLKPKVKLEGGVNSFGFGRSGKMGRGTESFFRIASPLFGVTIQHDVSARAYAGIGVQYTSTGGGESYHSKWFSPLDQYYHITDESEEIRLHKLVVPVTIGYRFSIRKVRASVFGGVKAIRYTHGRYQYRYNLKEDGINTINRNISFDPINNDSLWQQGRRTNYELFVGADVIVYKNFSLAISCSAARYMVSFEERNTPWGAPDTYHWYWKPDVLLSLTWIVTRNTKPE